jgi:hypothetical protein
VARRTVERLMRRLVLRGAMRGKRFRSTIPDAAGSGRLVSSSGNFRGGGTEPWNPERSMPWWSWP